MLVVVTLSVITTNRIGSKMKTVAKMEIVQVKDYSVRYKFENPELLEVN